MDLVQKGATANLPAIKQLLVTLSWSIAADFDLCAVYEAKDGRKGMVYFGDKGDMNAFPYISLDEDAGVGDSGGDNQETMRVVQMDEMDKIHIVCWDYGQVNKGAPARFEGSDVKIAIMDDTGTDHAAILETGTTGNVAIVATLDNSSPMGAKLVNVSKAGTLKELKKLDQLFDIINA